MVFVFEETAVCLPRPRPDLGVDPSPLVKHNLLRIVDIVGVEPFINHFNE
jgi:hypothetical protein